MRHRKFLATDSYTKVDVVPASPNRRVVRPTVADGQSTSRNAPFSPTPAAPDVPVAVGALIIGSYVALIGAFAIGMVGSAQSIYAIAIVAVFLIAFFTVPRIFFAVEPQQGERTSFARFMQEGIETQTGHSSGKEALILILLVPVLLTCAAIAMGITAAIVL